MNDASGCDHYAMQVCYVMKCKLICYVMQVCHDVICKFTMLCYASMPCYDMQVCYASCYDHMLCKFGVECLYMLSCYASLPWVYEPKASSFMLKVAFWQHGNSYTYDNLYERPNANL